MRSRTIKFDKYDIRVDAATIAPHLRQPLVDHLSEMLTPERLQRLDGVLANRTQYVTTVLENVSKSHNAGAVLRSCDSFGVQDLHVIDTYQQYEIKVTAAGGAHQWVTQHLYDSAESDNTLDCINKLKQQGYRILATSLRPDAVPLHQVSLDQPIALCFGTELFGLSDTIHNQADMWVQVPLVGFSDSLNISVAAAICLHDLTDRLRRSKIDWRLSAETETQLRLQWLIHSIDRSDIVVDHFLKENSP